MMHLFGDPAIWLPLVFAGLMGLSILIYVVLDGFDLGIGMLFALGDEGEQDRMMASIGPFWDANETWLVLAVGLLLVAFPIAHGIILSALYLPVALMLIGLILHLGFAPKSMLAPLTHALLAHVLIAILVFASLAHSVAQLVLYRRDAIGARQ